MKRIGSNFKLMVMSQMISIFGSTLLRITLSIYVLDLTGRADLFAGMLAISIIPGILFLPLGGALADHFSRKRLMVTISLVSSISIFLFLILIQEVTLGIVLVGAVITILSSLNALYQPLIQSSVPLLVSPEHYAQANGYVGASSALSGILGPIAAGLLYGVLGVDLLVGISASIFLMAAIFEMFIHIPHQEKDQSKIIKKLALDIKNGLSYMVKSNPHILKLAFIGMGINLILMPFFIVGAPYIIRVSMGANDQIYGISVAIIQSASVVGALMVGFLAHKIKINEIYKIIAFMGLMTIPLALSVIPYIMNLGFWFTYICLMFFMVPIIMFMTMTTLYVVTSVQRETPHRLLGKVLAVVTMISQLAAPLGQYLLGELYQTFNANLFIPTILISLFTFILAIITKILLKTH